MKKISIFLFPIAIVFALLSLLHLSYSIDYKSIDETLIGLVLLLISNCICLFYIYKFSKRKKIDYIIFTISIIIWMFIFLQNKYQVITFSNQNIIPIISYISLLIIILPLFIGLINYINIIKSIKK
mgnify:CR=1 FL=1